MDLIFRMVKSGTDEPMKLPKFYFTLFDLDTAQPGGDQSGGAEVVSSSGYYKYHVTNTTELLIEEKYGRTQFTSTVFGTGADNPTDPFKMTQLQQNRAITYEFRDTSEFPISYDITPGGGSRGRDVYFAGRSDLAAIP